MSINITCDICGNGMEEQVLVVTMTSTGTSTDVCSPQCLGALAVYLGPDLPERTETEPEEEMGDPGPKRKMSDHSQMKTKARLIPQEPVKRYPTEEETERLTGVIKRY